MVDLLKNKKVEIRTIFAALCVIMYLIMTTLLIVLRCMGLQSHRPILRSFSSNSNSVKFHIRPASVDDIFKINQCNLENLKENYSYQFYHSQISRFPDLSLIAETDRYEMVIV